MKEGLTDAKMFIISITIFAATLLFCGYVYYAVNAPLDLKANKKNVEIEITLPVLEWTKYTNLTKTIGKVLGVKTSRARVPSAVNNQAGDEISPFFIVN